MMATFFASGCALLVVFCLIISSSSEDIDVLPFRRRQSRLKFGHRRRNTFQLHSRSTAFLSSTTFTKSLHQSDPHFRTVLFPVSHNKQSSRPLVSVGGAGADSVDPKELIESIVVDDVLNDVIEHPIHEGDNPIPSSQTLPALRRAVEIGNILGSHLLAPILSSLTQNGWPTAESGGWDSFWSTSSSYGSKGEMTNAQRLTSALEQLGPTYVKFGQALGSRPDIVPPSLAKALSVLQDDMKPFDGDTAREIVWRELRARVVDENSSDNDVTPGKIRMHDLNAILSNITDVPIAAASIGQVYKAFLPGKGDVAVKIQRPKVRMLVERDTELLLAIARFLESLPALPSREPNTDPKTKKQRRLINTKLVAATQEFMSRIFEELDYRNEANNCRAFADLYSRQNGSSKDVKVVVPKVYMEWCTENVLVMEWIDGTKLTDIQTSRDNEDDLKTEEKDTVTENLSLVKVAIDSTLSQLLVTGFLHADPHAGNLLKVQLEDGSSTLGYLDFGIVSSIPSQVRDALVCSVALQVFSRDVDSVSNLFGELQLIPQHILDDPTEREALSEALEITFENSLLYPSSQSSEVDATAIPELKFDKLLDSLSRLVPRFQFDLPPYFINNARALSTLEGIAKSLDPSFNVLTVMYPFALNRLLRNPSGSPIVTKTMQSLIRTDDGRIDRRKIKKLLNDSALISGLSKRRVLWDVMKTIEGRKLATDVLREGLQNTFLHRIDLKSRDQRKTKRKRWYYLEL